jgi:hypothetical protein
MCKEKCINHLPLNYFQNCKQISFKGKRTSLRNNVKELGLQSKKTRNSRVVLVKKYNVM